MPLSCAFFHGSLVQRELSCGGMTEGLFCPLIVKTGAYPLRHFVPPPLEQQGEAEGRLLIQQQREAGGRLLIQQQGEAEGRLLIQQQGEARRRVLLRQKGEAMGKGGVGALLQKTPGGQFCPPGVRVSGARKIYSACVFSSLSFVDCARAASRFFKMRGSMVKKVVAVTMPATVSAIPSL